MKKTIIILLINIISQEVQSQKIHLQGGVNISSFNLDYHDPDVGFSGIYVRDMYRQVYIGKTLSAGVEFWDKNKISLLTNIQWNELGGNMGTSQFDKDLQFAFDLKENFSFTQLSLNPLLRYKLIDKDKFNFSIYSGGKLDYILSISNFSNTSYNRELYKKHLSKLNLSLTAGIGYEFKLNEQISISTNLFYNNHITNISKESIGFSSTTNGQNNQNFSSYVNYFQCLLGATYQLNH